MNPKTIFQKLGMLIVMFSVFFSVSATDFSFNNIQFRIISVEDRTVAVIGVDVNKKNLQAISIPDKVVYRGKTYRVTTIGGRTFADCSALVRVSIGNSVTTIGEEAFYNCDALTSIMIPKGVTSVGTSAFGGCSTLESIDVDSENENYASYNGILYNKDKTSLICCPGAKKIVNIPSSVTTIEERAFYDCDSLTSVMIGDSVNLIRPRAFYDCDALISVTLPDSVITMGWSSFYSCDALTSVTIGNSVTAIGEEAFYDCDSLTSVTIGNSVDCILPRAFYDCDSLTSITIPNSVKSIRSGAFSFCDALTSVTLGDSVTTIGEEAFYGCMSLKCVYNLNKTPIECNPGFHDKVITSATLYIPTGTLAAYQQVGPWRDFWNIEETDFSGIEDVDSDKVGIRVSVSDGVVSFDGLTGGEEIVVYDMQGKVVYHGTETSISKLTSGVYIVKVGGETIKFVI